jgi:hypothetical protein
LTTKYRNGQEVISAVVGGTLGAAIEALGAAIVYAAIAVGIIVVTNGVIQWAKKSKSSGKEKADDIPSWARGQKKLPGESGKDFAKRLMDDKYGKGNYDTGPSSEFNKIKKWGDRGAK